MDFTSDTKTIILEMYKAHYSAKETALTINAPYQKITAIFRGFKVAGINKYDRLHLSPTLSNHLNTMPLN